MAAERCNASDDLDVPNALDASADELALNLQRPRETLRVIRDPSVWRAVARLLTVPEEFPIAMLVERYYRPLTASVW